MRRVARIALAILLGGASLAAGAQSLGLSNYAPQGTYRLDVLGGRGLEASAVTYARDRGSLFFVGDEGLGVVEISRTGQTLGSMAFTWPTASTNNDAEGLAYLGNGTLVVVEERLQAAYRFSYTAGGTAALENAPFVKFGTTVGNIGTEGIAWDARDGSFVTVKQESPQNVLGGALTFGNPPAGGTSGLAALFNPAGLGVTTLSDVATLSGVDALAGTAAADHLLILSLSARRLFEVTRTGTVLGSLDLSAVTPQAIEGVTVDENGVLYLVAEDSGFGASQLIVYAPIPEPHEYALMLGGLAVLSMAAARRRRSARLTPTLG